MKPQHRTPDTDGVSVSRRGFLRGAGVVLGLPLLDGVAFGVGPGAGPGAAAGAKGAAAPPRRMVGIETNMGILPTFFFPEKAGKDYVATPYLEKLAAHRDRMTVFSGVSHPGVTGGHAAEKCFLTGTPHPDRGGFRNGVSLDQYAAEQIGNRTRHPSLVVLVGNEHQQTLSFTRSGAPIPAERSPRRLYEKLFVQGKPDEVAASVEALRQGRSMLDFVGASSARLNGRLSAADRDRLDHYFTSVRELEGRLKEAEAWEHRPKPKVASPAPTDITDAREFVSRSRTIYDLLALALQTDSTRIISLFIDTTVIHNITHHGNRPEVLDELKGHEAAQFAALGGFLDKLASIDEGGRPLLDSTMVLYGTCMGSANSHANNNLPVLLAGGGFRHAGHLAFDTAKNYPLTNLFVSMLQRLGIKTDTFSTGRGTMRGLDFEG